MNQDMLDAVKAEYLVRIVVNDYDADNIRCNAVCLGPIETPLLKDVLTDDVLLQYHDAIPAGGG